MATLADDLVDVRPTVMFGVPRIFEKVREQVEAHADVAGEAPLHPFGLDRLRVAVCGGAPLAADLVEFFAGHGLRMCNTYGMTEAGAIASAWDREPRPDTCGAPYPGVSIRIAPDGEALVRSTGLCLGYYNDLHATAELFTEDGFLRTGDIVEFTSSGDVRVVDRKKDIIITSGGKNISPSAIQHALARSPYINQAVLVGNNRRYVAALLEVSAAAINERLNSASDYGDLIEDPEARVLLEAAVTAVNDTLSPPEQIKAWAPLPEPLRPTDPEVTPTMKVKRGAFELRYAELIESLYE
jgi:long-chain acyl-CoA synthetase